MLRDMLRQELPEALVLWDRRPRIRVPRMHPTLAALAGVGVHWLSLSFIRGAVFLSASLTGIPPVRTFDLTEAVSWAAAAIVAFASAGRRGLLLLIASAVAIAALQALLALPGITLFCERSGGTDPLCEPMRAVFGAWPLVLGLVLGVVTRRAASTGARGHLSLALGASIVVLAPLFVRVAAVPFIGLDPTSVPARDLFDWLIGSQLAAAFAMGFVAGRFGQRHVLAAVLISGAYLLPWLPFFRLYLVERPPVPFVFESQWQSLTPAMFALAALLGLVIGAVARIPTEHLSTNDRRNA